MNKIKLRKNDDVIVIAGKEKGKVGKIVSLNHKANTIVIKDINKVTKHKKPSQTDTEGGIKTFEAPIHASNVALLLKKATKGTPATFSKIGTKINKNGTKSRIARKTKKEI
ncbi:50S ribosomal protein L24 [Mycoplasmopsis hyopharyngis]|uniref:50S ribosomal protein L24 n=1 Tax=Mycoplasmopsis hyopharyngis TaxID=29558 RepID=UPI003873AE11